MAYLTHLFKIVDVYADNTSSEQTLYKIPQGLSPLDNIPIENKIDISVKSSLKEIAQTFINNLDDTELKNRMLSDLNANKLVSDTGELTFDLNLNSYLINTQYMAGVVGTLSNNIYTLGKVTLKGNIEKGTMSATALDDKPLDESGRILVTYTTDVAATGEKYEQDSTDSQKLIYTRGLQPSLIKYSTAEVKLAVKRYPNSYTAYKLDIYGNRVGKLPLSIDGNTITVQLETDAGFAFEIASSSASFRVGDRNIESLSELLPGDTVTADINVLNDTGVGFNGQFIVALYNQKSLADVKILPIKMTAEEPFKTLSHSIKLPDENIDGYYIKSFLFDDLYNICPLKDGDSLY